MKAFAAVTAALAVTLSLAAQAIGRTADITIFDRTSGRTLPVYWHYGSAYVVGKPGNEYKIVVRNRHGEDLLAVVSVDGVNVLSGQTASPDQGGYVLPARGRVEVRGWRKSLQETASFYFTSLADSYADRTWRPENVGVIGIALFERAEDWPDRESGNLWDPKRGKSEQGSKVRPKSHGTAPGEPLGTGHGKPEYSRARPTEFERASPYPVETVTIYYDSYRNLVAQGAIPSYGRREADPFPVPFVPDPPRYHW